MSDAAHAKRQTDNGPCRAEYSQEAVQPRQTIDTRHTQQSLKTLSGARNKRIFDCTITLLAAPLWLPAIAICAISILLLEGRPIFYVSRRETGLGQLQPILKFRTMRRDVDKIINRDTVPVINTVFLNVERTSDIYTPIGHIIERLALTELPQLFHVLAGTMSLVGSRPLPARVMDMLRAKYPDADLRFLTKAGLTGPVQLVGRDCISDADRLKVEARYCQIASSDDYSMWLDMWLLLYTVLVVIVPSRLLTVAEVSERMRRRFKRSPWQLVFGPPKRRDGQ